MISDRQFNRLPKVFQDKIKIDRGVDKLRKRKVIDFKHGGELIRFQQTSRYRCQAYLKKKTEGNA